MSARGQKATLSEPIKSVCYRGLSGRDQRRSRPNRVIALESLGLAHVPYGGMEGA